MLCLEEKSTSSGEYCLLEKEMTNSEQFFFSNQFHLSPIKNVEKNQNADISKNT